MYFEKYSLHRTLYYIWGKKYFTIHYKFSIFNVKFHYFNGYWFALPSLILVELTSIVP